VSSPAEAPGTTVTEALDLKGLGMNIPESLRYTADHEWARPDGDVVVVGITDHAQSQMGDVVHIEHPAVGSGVVAGDPVGEIESVKSVSEVYAPVSGTIAAINGAVDTEPELLNSDPYGEGWLISIRPTDPTAIESLLDASAYLAIVESAEAG
jgi:glycine cleavage system H protein